MCVAVPWMDVKLGVPSASVSGSLFKDPTIYFVKSKRAIANTMNKLKNSRSNLHGALDQWHSCTPSIVANPQPSAAYKMVMTLYYVTTRYLFVFLTSNNFL